MPRRKSLREEIFEVTIKGEKYMMHFTLDEKGQPKAEVTPLEKNAEKISFGIIRKFQSRLEGCAYRKDLALKCLLFLNGEWIIIDRVNWRRLMSIIMKMGYFLGITKHKRRK